MRLLGMSPNPKKVVNTLIPQKKTILPPCHQRHLKKITTSQFKNNYLEKKSASLFSTCSIKSSIQSLFSFSPLSISIGVFPARLPRL